MNKSQILGPRIDYQSNEFNIMQPNFSLQGKINEGDILETENFTGAGASKLKIKILNEVNRRKENKN